MEYLSEHINIYDILLELYCKSEKANPYSNILIKSINSIHDDHSIMGILWIIEKYQISDDILRSVILDCTNDNKTLYILDNIDDIIKNKDKKYFSNLGEIKFDKRRTWFNKKYNLNIC